MICGSLVGIAERAIEMVGYRRRFTQIMSATNFFPDMVTSLVRADIPIEGLSAYLLQAEKHQVVIMAFDNDVHVPEHSHEAQWGVVLDGRMDLTIEGQTQILKRGDSYYVPKGAKHSSVIFRGYKDITLFNQKDRYLPVCEPRIE